MARCCQVSPSTVSTYVVLARAAGLSWSIAEDLDLEKILLGAQKETHQRPQPDWSMVHRELKRKGVTLMLLWEEYKLVHPNGYQYIQSSVKYKAWLGIKNLSMRQIHKAGEKIFVEFAGQTVEVDDPELGRFQAQIFVACLGVSQ